MSQPDSTARRASALLDAYAARGRFQGVAAVGRDGNTLVAEARGYAEVAEGRPLSGEHRLPIGSLTKAITAAAVLKLQDAGELSVNDPVQSFLPAGLLPYGDEVTLHHLLTHTSGIPSLLQPPPGGVAVPDQRARTQVSRQELVATFSTRPPLFAPGERFSYSNSGYALLAIVIEQCTGLSFASALAEHVFGPSGMASAGLEPRATDARGHFGGDPTLLVNPSWRLGSGDVICSAPDLIRFGRALEDGRLLSAAALTAMTAPQVATRVPGQAYGYGWRVHRGSGRLVHAAGLAGLVGVHVWIPEERLRAVVLLTEVSGWEHMTFATRQAARIADELLALVRGSAQPVGPPAPARLSDSELERLAGRYTDSQGRELEVRVEGGRLLGVCHGPRPWTLHGVGSLAPASGARRGDRALALLRTLHEGRFADARAHFAADHRRQLSPGDLQAMWAAVLRELGHPTEVCLFQVLEDVAYLRLRFGAGGPERDARVVFDPDDAVAGLYLVAPGMGPASTMQELVPVADGRLVTDGYPWGVEDVEVTLRADGSLETAALPST